MKVALQQDKPDDGEYIIQIEFSKTRHVNFSTSEHRKTLDVFDVSKGEISQLILDLSSLLAQAEVHPDLTHEVTRPINTDNIIAQKVVETPVGD